MSQKLTTISPSYNSFVPDQVLTHKQLNGVIDYFEDQNRMSRLRLSGSGIVCGFKLSLEADNESNAPVKPIRLTLSQGTGITTDGDLIYNKPIDDEGVYTTNCKPFQFTRFRPFDDSPVDYFKNRIDTYEDGQIIELIPKEDATITGTTPDVSDFDYANVSGGLNAYIFFIYLESYSKETGACTSTSCETQGSEFVQKVRYLLINKVDAQKVINHPTYTDTLYKDKKSYEVLQDGLLKLQVKRMIFHKDTNVLPADNSDQVKSYYESAIHDGTTYSLLKTGLDTLCAKVGLQPIATKIDSVLGFTSSAIPSDIQYRYDLFKDLVETYNEARDLIMHIDTVCCPLTESFPKHLMIGGFSSAPLAVESAETTTRHSFYESPLIGNDKRNYEKALSLLNRAHLLTTAYNKEDKSGEIKIVPSVLRGELGEKAIPFYYTPGSELIKLWDFEKTYNRLQKTNLSYHTALLSPAIAIQNPLEFCIDENDFFRIEGLQGKTAQDVKDFLELQKQTFGLDFDIVVADVTNTEMTLSQLIQEQPSISHYAGVPRGGTFVLATQNDVVFADFAFVGKLVPKQEVPTGVGCCDLVECTYPWISSLKYLNNLSRSLNGTQSKEQSMPKNYILRVLKYEINGVSLKSSANFEDISIPMSQIFLRRMHAVTEAMNTKYPKGLVFDFNEAQKRFMITRPKNDKYVLQVQDVTLSSIGAGSLQPKYTYSSNGMYRQPLTKPYGVDLTHRPFVMICRDLRNYNPTLYESLQALYAPKNKDDDNHGDYRYKWAEFYKLRDRLPENGVIRELKLNRFVKVDTELPFNEQQRLAQMIRDMIAADQAVQQANAEEVLEQQGRDSATPMKQTEGAVANRASNTSTMTFMLDGDWVNGTWVNSDMVAIWKNINATGTVPSVDHQEIYDFIELKELLHEDHLHNGIPHKGQYKNVLRGVTNMSFYITNRPYHSGYDDVIKKYEKIADFYFIGEPTGKNAIHLNGGQPGTPPGDDGGTDPAPQDPTPIGDTENTREPAGTEPSNTTSGTTASNTSSGTAPSAEYTKGPTEYNRTMTAEYKEPAPTEAVNPSAGKVATPMETAATSTKAPTPIIPADPVPETKKVPTGTAMTETVAPTENVKAPVVNSKVMSTATATQPTVEASKVPTTARTTRTKSPTTAASTKESTKTTTVKAASAKTTRVKEPLSTTVKRAAAVKAKNKKK